jgi:hypothetical protein
MADMSWISSCKQCAGGLLFLAVVGTLCCAAAPAGELTPKSPAAAVKKYDPTDQYEVLPIEGWRVLVNKPLQRDQSEVCAQTLKLLGLHLYGVVRHVPAEAVTKLRQIAIWVEWAEPNHPCMAYHPDAGWLREHNMNPDKAGCVEIANARNFLTWTLDQPVMVLHELAHGYHDRFLPGGFQNPGVAAAYQRAKDAKLYDKVLRRGYHRERAYAMNNPMEYFAETSEAFFGTNDFYPFVRAELQDHDPPMFALLQQLWEGKQPAGAKPAGGAKDGGR